MQAGAAQGRSYPRLAIAFLLALSLVLAACESAKPDLQDDPEVVRSLEALVREWQLSTQAIGVTLAVSTENRGGWVGAAGVSNRDDESPVAPNVLFRAGSITKTFVAVVVLRASKSLFAACENKNLV